MRTLKYLGAFLAWNLVMSAAAFLLPPVAAIPVVIGAYLILVRALMGGTGRATSRRRALLRLRPLRGEALRLTLLSIPVLLLLAWSLESIYLRLVPVPPDTLDPLGPLMETPMGALTVAILAVGMAPIVEEVFFRGLIQRTLELRLGTGWGIGIASALFAAVHLLPWVFPLHLFLGLVFGFAVYAARSIWAGVVLHAANNAAALLGMALLEEEQAATPTIWEIGPTLDLWAGLGIVVLAGALLAWIGRRLWWAGRRLPSFRPEARPAISTRRQGGRR